MHCKWLYHTDRLESGCVQREIEWIFLGEMERGSDIRDVEKWYGLNPQNQSNDRYSRMANHAYSGRKPGKQRGAFLTVNSPTWLKEGERVSEMNQWVDSHSRWLFEAHIPNSCRCQKEWLKNYVCMCRSPGAFAISAHSLDTVIWICVLWSFPIEVSLLPWKKRAWK